VWSASGGVYNLDRAIRYAFRLPAQRYVEARARAVVGAFVVVVALGALALGWSVVGAHASVVAVVLVGVPVALVGLTAGIGTMYRFSIGAVVPVRRLLPGAASAAVATVIALAVFGAYLGMSTRFTAAYGAFAGIVIGMFAA